MDSQLEKLVESGKLTSAAAEKLEHLPPGTFCLHKSWGFGRVAEWNLLVNQIAIDFAGKKGHAMQIQYAADNLTPLTTEHFLSRKATDLPGVKQLIKSDPAAVMRNILESTGGSATVQQISEMLLGDIFNEAEWKRWWDSTKKLLKSTGYFSVPAKKTEPVQLRGEKVARSDELAAFFEQARQPKEQAAAIDQMVKFHHEFDDPEKQLQPIIAAIENIAARNQKLHPEYTFDLVISRDDLIERFPKLHTTHIGLTLSKLIQEEEKRLVSILPKLVAAKEKRVLQVLPEALGERWTERALQLMQVSHARLVAQIARIFSEAGHHAELRATIERSIKEHSATGEMLVWLCGERERWNELITPALFGAILSAIDRDQHNNPTRGSRLQRTLVEDRQLLGAMFAEAEVGPARDAMRKLLLSPLFDELTKRSLLARIVKLHPQLEGMITGGQTEEKAAALVVSWSSLEKRKIEYEELVKKKIPENVKEIALARSYGDLSENFEYKAAKQMQAVLGRRRAELETALQNARGTAFESPDTSRVSIGTVVTLRDEKSRKEETYSILGAWDGDPQRNIISYQAAIGQALLGHALGEVVTLNTDTSSSEFSIIAIEAAPRDATPPDPNVMENLVEAAVAE
ncbi:MAG: GreA/GreB family elongation factor [Spartobacteria bacterium]